MNFIILFLVIYFADYRCVSEYVCSVVERKSNELRPCIFPFKFNGVSYDTCTDVKDPNNKLWCSTKVDSDGNHVKAGGFWGHCDQDCDFKTIDEAEFSSPSVSDQHNRFAKCGENTNPERIIQSTAVGSWPWMGSLGFWSDEKKVWNHKCGATLVTQSNILTAAHCVVSNETKIKESWKVRLGDYNHSSSNDDDDVQEVNVLHILIHPKFVKGKAYYDVAVLIIPDVAFTIYVRPICLPRPSEFKIDQYEDRSSTLIGWGNSVRNGQPSDSLRRTILTIYDYSYCNTTHENTSGKTKALVKQYLPELFQPTLLCAGYESADQGSCQGDSGGPLMFYNTKLLQFFQVGIVSGGVSSCGDKEIPGYYTRLDHPDISEFVHNANDILSKESDKNEVIEYSADSIFMKYTGTLLNGKPDRNGTMLYKNGASYVGEWLEGLRHGKGFYQYEENVPEDYYDGNFENDTKSGYGVQTWINGEKYIGEWKNNLRNGLGNLTYNRNDKYDRKLYAGDWKDDYQDGFGILYFKSGAKYEGEWSKGQKNGHGLYKFEPNAEIDYYEGSYVNDTKWGQGVQVWANGEKYIGEWKNDLRNGMGNFTISISKEGLVDLYVGNWKEDKMEGYGIGYFISGAKYEGEWFNGLLNGIGNFTYAKDDPRGIYVGGWRNANQEGFGIMYDKTGAKYEGEWRKGAKNGKGNFSYPIEDSKEFYDGEWKNDFMSGMGVLYYKDGQKYDGHFENDQKSGFGTETYGGINEGNTYEGQFKNDVRSGNGTFTVNIGDDIGEIYEGEWANNMRHGFGKIIYGGIYKGNMYEGQFKYDRRSGNGTFTSNTDSETGEVYEGEWFNGLRHGYGKTIYGGINKGSMYEGQFKENYRSGQGTYMFSNGNKYEGQFKDGFFFGNGTYTFKDGRRYTGGWEKDNYNGYGVLYTSDGDIEQEGQWKDGTFIAR